MDTGRPSSDVRRDWLRARRDEAAQTFTGTIHLARPGETFAIQARNGRD